MDPRHKLTKSLDQLFVDSSNPAIMSARTDDEAARNAASSGVTPEAIKQKLAANLGATHVEIEDMSGTLYCVFNVNCAIFECCCTCRDIKPPGQGAKIMEVTC